MSIPEFRVWGLTGLPEVAAGDDLVALLLAALGGQAALDPSRALREGDILVVTSKIVSKSEGRQVPAAERESAIDLDTVRVVAERHHAGGVTKIVETRQGFVMAAAGLDMSNVPEGIALRLPEDPDRSALQLCAALRERLGISVGVIITDTVGRPWRVGQTDLAIGAAGLRLSDDLRGAADANGRPLHVTQAVSADEIAGAADLVKGKASGIPVAVVRGLGRYVCGLDAPGARSLLRLGDEDMFRFGSTEAWQQGYDAARAEIAAAGLATQVASIEAVKPKACAADLKGEAPAGSAHEPLPGLTQAQSHELAAGLTTEHSVSALYKDQAPDAARAKALTETADISAVAGSAIGHRTAAVHARPVEAVSRRQAEPAGSDCTG